MKAQNKKKNKKGKKKEFNNVSFFGEMDER